MPEAFFLSEISGSVVTLTWEIAQGRGPCQPYHEVTVQGHGKVTLKPGVTELKADLDNHCEHFNAYVKATILGRSSGIRGPIHGVTGPTGEWNRVRRRCRPLMSPSPSPFAIPVLCLIQRAAKANPVTGSPGGA